MRDMALNRRQIRFLIQFFALLAVFYIVIGTSWGDRYLVAPFTRGLTQVAALLLNLVGLGVVVEDTVIRNNFFAVDIKNGCNGIEALVFLCAAMFAFAAPLKDRLLGILVAAVAVQALNLVRIVSLYLLGRYRREIFDMFHLAVWQSVIFGAAVFMFVYWTTRVTRRDATAG